MSVETPSMRGSVTKAERQAASLNPATLVRSEVEYIRRQRYYARQRLQQSLGGATTAAKTLANPVYWYKRHPVATVAVGAAAALVAGFVLLRGRQRETRAVTEHGQRVRLVREPGWLSWLFGALLTSVAAGPRAMIAAAMTHLLATQAQPEAAPEPEPVEEPVT